MVIFSGMIGDINGITALFAGIFLIPIATGIIYPVSSYRVKHSFLAFLNNLELAAGIFLALYLYKLVFIDRNAWFLFPGSVIFFFLSLLAIFFVLHFLTAPIYRYAVIPVLNKISAGIDDWNGVIRRIAGGLWQLPKALWFILVFALLLNICTYYAPTTPAADYIGSSRVYSAINEKVLRPALDTDMAKKIPIFARDAFRELNEGLDSGNRGRSKEGGRDAQTVDSIFPVVEFFNGVTLEEAVESSDEIDETALKIIGTEQEPKKKAQLLYRWIAENIEYDYDKAKALSSDPSSLKSGARVAFAAKKGICFDYAALYVAMCRAAELKVRLVTGLGYNGASWGDHAWNQIYDPVDQRWIDLDVTFGSAGQEAFDRQDFSRTHKNADIQGEW